LRCSIIHDLPVIAELKGANQNDPHTRRVYTLQGPKRPIKIRRADVDDAPSIAEVHFAAAHEIYQAVLPGALLSCLSVNVRAKQWRDVIARSAGDDAVFVAEVSNGNPIGFGYCSPQRSLDLANKGFNGEIQSLFLTKSTRGNGAGKALMAAMAAHIMRQNINGAACWVLRENFAARRFYEHSNAQLIDEMVMELDKVSICMEVAYGWLDLAELANAASHPMAAVLSTDAEIDDS
jgi:GNAT superfamily N-acetyltransferase